VERSHERLPPRRRRTGRQSMRGTWYPLLSPGSVCCALAGGSQRLIARPLLDATFEVFQRCRRCDSWMPNDPYDLANAPAPTANYRRRVRRGWPLAVSAAAVTDHVCDSWHGLTASRTPVSGWRKRTPAWARGSTQFADIASIVRGWGGGEGRDLKPAARGDRRVGGGARSENIRNEPVK
jgi:hypothetical protein